MTTGVDTQRYNPEVPLESNPQSTKLNELVDKLIKIRKNIFSAIPSTTRPFDVQNDMAGHDEEGSGRMMTDDVDDEEYGNMHGSGDGSGDGGPTSSPFDPMDPTVITSNDIEPRASAAATLATLLLGTLTATLVTITLSSRSYALLNL